MNSSKGTGPKINQNDKGPLSGGAHRSDKKI